MAGGGMGVVVGAGFFQSLEYFDFKTLKFVALFGGFFLFFVARTSMEASIRTSMQIIAHELTHSFFCGADFSQGETYPDRGRQFRRFDGV